MRVVSLLPAAAEIVAALGAADLLVGVSHECDYPAHVAGLPRVTRSAVDGGCTPGEIDRQVRAASAAGEALYELDEALIAELAPDLIITQGVCGVCAVSEGEVCALAQRLGSSPRVLSLSATTLEGVLDDIASIARALSLEEVGEELIAGLTARMRAVHDTLKAAGAPRPRVALLEWTDPVFSGGHWVPQMIRRAGGIDVLALAGERSRVVELAEVAAARPDVVILAPCGYDLARAAAEARQLLCRENWRWLAETRLWAIDANSLMSRPSPRLVDGIETLARILHPGLFRESPRIAHCALRIDSSSGSG
jgi:iron complex transport system substrate-binding protein